MPLPPLNALRTFEAAARHLSFSRAADEIHVTHAAVSHQIRHLEEWFGFSLFIRAGRGVRLTPSGESLSKVLSTSLSAIERECTQLRQRGAQERVTVACIPSIASRWLIPALPLYAERNPAHDIRVVYAGAEDRLRDTDSDLLVTLGADPSPGTMSRRIFSRLNRPVASPGYLARKGAIDLSTIDLLHDETTGHWTEWFCKAGVQRAGPLRGPVFQDFNMLATAVVAGHGAALCPVDVIRREIISGDLVVLSDISILDEEGYFLITGPDASRAALGFADWFAGLMQGHIRQDGSTERDRAPAARRRSRPE